MTNHRGDANYRTVITGSEGQGEIPTNPVLEDQLILSFDASSHRILASDTILNSIVYADKDTVEHALCVIGITMNAALAGDIVNYVTSGKILDVVGLVPGRVWLGNSGEMTQVVPLTGFILCLGTVLDDSTTMIVNIGHSIIRS